MRVPRNLPYGISAMGIHSAPDGGHDPRPGTSGCSEGVMYVGFLEVLRGRAVRQPMQIIGHMAETPRIILDNGRKYMVFSLTEAAETEFRLKE